MKARLVSRPCACLIALVFSVTTLSGCNDSGSPRSESVPAVDGEIRYISDPVNGGMSFTAATQDSWQECGGDRYFETELVRVYGEDGVPDEHKARIASQVHFYWDRVAAAFELSEEDYRHRYRSTLIEHYLDYLGPRVGSSSFSADAISPVIEQALEDGLTTPDDPNAWRWRIQNRLSELRSEELEALFRNTELAFKEEEGHIGQFYSAQGTPQTLSFDPEMITVCVDPAMPSGAGTGFTWGIEVGSSPDGQIVHHELVHYAQARLFGGEAFVHAPRWFTEGQATYLAGQQIAGERNYTQLNPVDIEHCYNEAGTINDDSVCLSANEPYNHYALAYGYLTAGTSAETIREFMAYVYNTGSTMEFPRFKAEFGYYFRKPDGSPLHYEDYQQHYHSLLAAFFEEGD